MRIKTVRGSNQYQSKGELVGVSWCKNGHFNEDGWTEGNFPMPIKHKVCQREDCNAEIAKSKPMENL